MASVDQIISQQYNAAIKNTKIAEQKLRDVPTDNRQVINVFVIKDKRAK